MISLGSFSIATSANTASPLVQTSDTAIEAEAVGSTEATPTTAVAVGGAAGSSAAASDSDSEESSAVQALRKLIAELHKQMQEQQ